MKPYELSLPTTSLIQPIFGKAVPTKSVTGNVLLYLSWPRQLPVIIGHTEVIAKNGALSHRQFPSGCGHAL